MFGQGNQKNAEGELASPRNHEDEEPGDDDQPTIEEHSKLYPIFFSYFFSRCCPVKVAGTLLQRNNDYVITMIMKLGSFP
jgi:hypothetical protein